MNRRHWHSDGNFAPHHLLSVYPPVKWEGVLDAVNRLPVDVAESYSTVRKDTGWDEGMELNGLKSRLSCTANLLRGKD